MWIILKHISVPRMEGLMKTIHRTIHVTVARKKIPTHYL